MAGVEMLLAEELVQDLSPAEKRRRNRQLVVDQFLNGEITAEEFRRRNRELRPDYRGFVDVIAKRTVARRLQAERKQTP